MTDLRITNAAAADLSAMAEIWQICFGDKPSYIQFFFRHRLPSAHAFTARTGGKTAGAVYLLPAVLYDGETRRRAYYVYALGVLPEYRGHGIASAMMRRIFDICKEQSAVCFLKPASPSLAAFYRRLGMIPTHFSAEQRFAAAQNTLAWTPLTAEEYAAMRLALPPLPGGVVWDADAIRYAFDENGFCGGFCLRCTVGSKTCAVLGRREENRLRIEDCIGSNPQAVLPALCAHLGTKEAVLRIPCPPSEPDAFLIGMTYTMNAPASGPLRLLLD